MVLKKDKYFGFAEDEILKNTKKAAPLVADSFKKVATEDVRQDSVNYIENGAANGQARSIGERTNPFGGSISNSGNDLRAASYDTNSFNQGSSSGMYDGSDNSMWKSGTTDTLILFATVLLVLLVFVVSYTVFNFLN